MFYTQKFPCQSHNYRKIWGTIKSKIGKLGSYYSFGKIRKALMLLSIPTSILNRLTHFFLTRNRTIRKCIIESNCWGVNFHFQWKYPCKHSSLVSRNVHYTYCQQYGKRKNLKTVVPRKESRSNFQKNGHFSPPDTYVIISQGKKC